MELRICHLFPDMLDLYGDRGNMICMKKRLEWRGIGCSAEKLNMGQRAGLSGYDLVFIGGGMEFDTKLLAQELRSGMAAELKAAVADGVTVMSVCSGFQLLGAWCEDAQGQRTELAGVVDMYTVAGKQRHTGNYKFICGEESGGSEVIGFENHLGITTLSEGLNPLGRTLCGFGNDGGGGEGLRYKNLFGTYSYGPLLPKNPALCDHILLTALERKYGKVSLAPLNDEAELAAHAAMSARLDK